MLRERGLDVRFRPDATPQECYDRRFPIKSLLKFSIDIHKPVPFVPLLDLFGRDLKPLEFTNAPASLLLPK